MHTKTRIGSASALAATLLSLILGCGGIIFLRVATPPPSPCPIEELLLDEEVMPDSWWIDSTGNPATRFGEEFESQRFSSRIGGVGLYTVYRERDDHKALRQWRSLVTSYFSVRDGWGTWGVPTEFTYESLIADHARLGCSTEFGTGQQRCQFIAKYGVYIAWLDMDMSDVMTPSDFERVLRDIDCRILECLPSRESQGRFDSSQSGRARAALP